MLDGTLMAAVCGTWVDKSAGKIWSAQLPRFVVHGNCRFSGVDLYLMAQVSTQIDGRKHAKAAQLHSGQQLQNEMF